MTQCKHIGCSNTAAEPYDYCVDCFIKGTNTPVAPAKPAPKDTSSGGDNDYWLIPIPHPKRLEPCTVETEDIIEALGMSFQEGEAFKAIIRKCKLRMGEGKPGDTEIRNAEKVAHFGGRMVAIEQRKLECTT